MFKLCLIITVLLGALHAEDYPKNPHVSEEVWNAVKPYFLPVHKPLKAQLDAIFAGRRVTASAETLRAAGFNLTEVQGLSVVVVKHPEIPGYVFKMLLDDQQSRRTDWESWLLRIRGAESTKRAIAKFNLGAYFMVADKWIYPLPGEGPRNFILVAKNLHPLPKQENLARWKKLYDKKILEGLQRIITKVGLADSFKEHNIPWCKNGKIAIIDTAHHHDQNLQYHRLERVLNPKMTKYWQKLWQKQKQSRGNFRSQAVVCRP